MAAEVGDRTEIILDTGIMSGADIVASLALGARFTLVGRAYLYGLMAGGQAGVDRAIDDPRRTDRPAPCGCSASPPSTTSNPDM